MSSSGMKPLSLNAIVPLENNKTARQELEDIATSREQEDAFFVMDVGNLMDKYDSWIRVLPGIKPYYAVKCNDSIIVLKTLAALGANFDCASMSEISRVISLGVPAERIIFANPVKQQTHIKYAAKVGVNLITFDNGSELIKIKEFNPSAKLILRLLADSESCQCMSMGRKFGASLSEAAVLLRSALSLGLDLVGVSFHVGSGNRDLSAYSRALRDCRSFYNLCMNRGVRLSIVDIGGGFMSDNFENMAASINKCCKEYFPAITGVRVIGEPGRFMVESAFTLATRVHSMRLNREEPMYYINDGIFGSLCNLLTDNIRLTPIPLTTRTGNEGPLYKSSIWGPTCDSLDQISGACLLPMLKINDWLIFEKMGAYTLPLVTRFNGFSVAAVHHVAALDKWMQLKKIAPDGLVKDE